MDELEIEEATWVLDVMTRGENRARLVRAAKAKQPRGLLSTDVWFSECGCLDHDPDQSGRRITTESMFEAFLAREAQRRARTTDRSVVK